MIIKEGGSLRAALFFVQKKSATMNDSGYGCRGTPLLKD